MIFPLSITLIIAAIALLLIYIIIYWAGYAAIPVPTVHSEASKSPSQSEAQGSSEASPGISVVIVTHDSDRMLERAIRQVAAQDYPNFEILIVNNASSDNTNDVIKRYAQLHPGLIRYTFLPQNKNGILHEAMAVTLGVRAARKEWVLLLKPTSVPKSIEWLRSFADAIQKGYCLCLGYNQFYGYDNAHWVKKTRRRLRKKQILNFRAIMRGKRKPLEAEGSNIAFRKDEFLSNGGYGKWLSLRNCHENLYVTTYFNSGTTIMLTTPDVQVETILPPIFALWQTERRQRKQAYHRFSIETRLRRSHYKIISILALMSMLALLAGLALCFVTTNFDNSTMLSPDMVYVSDCLPAIPLYAIIGAGGFLLILVLHLIFRANLKRRDRKRLFVPLISNPKVDFSDDFME